jgi:gluconolactonase
MDGKQLNREGSMRTKDLHWLAACAVLAFPAMTATSALAQAPAQPPPAPQIAPSLVPSYTVDLMSAEGSAAFGAQWKTMEAKIVEVPPIKDALPAYKTGYDIMPHAGEAGYDDTAWPVIEPKGLAGRLGAGRVSFIWYRANLTIPEKIGSFETAGAKAVFSAYVDDYAEVWVNGQMPRRSGYPSPATIQGLNMPNRVVLADAVKAGDKFQVAVFGINGPISVAPSNFVFFREAKIDFYK